MKRYELVIADILSFLLIEDITNTGKQHRISNSATY